jgi:hypothetical protein
MPLLVTLLSLTVTLMALPMFNLAVFGGFIDGASGYATSWSRVQLVDAIVILGLGVGAALLVWVNPLAAEVALWLAALAGLAGTLIEGGLLAGSTSEFMTPQLTALSVLVGGAAPAIAALTGALLTHRFVLAPTMLASAG